MCKGKDSTEKKGMRGSKMQHTGEKLLFTGMMSVVVAGSCV
jgi:hypothetical protein